VVPFQARLTGTVSFASGPAAGDRTVSLAMKNGTAVLLKVTISGPAVQGGVQMSTSSVALGPASAPARFTGRVVLLDGSALQAAVSGDGQRLTLAIELTSQTSTTVTGVMTVQRADQ